MTVEKFIRILGYIVYVALWSPVVVLGIIVFPFVFMVMFKSIPEGWAIYKMAMKSSFKHDMRFIKTGVWY